MAMRITTKMMQNRSLNNLNTNKTLQEKLTTQLSTMKKITRPSDDPVIAIRSLKLNSTLNKIDQYYATIIFQHTTSITINIVQRQQYSNFDRL